MSESKNQPYRAEVLARLTYVEHEPGNGTAYRLILVHLSGLPRAARQRIGAGQEALLVVWVNPFGLQARVAVLNRDVAWHYLRGLWPRVLERDVLEVARAIESATGWDLMTRCALAEGER